MLIFHKLSVKLMKIEKKLKKNSLNNSKKKWKLKTQKQKNFKIS